LPDRGGRQPGVPGRGPGRHRHRQQPAGACCHPIRRDVCPHGGRAAGTATQDEGV